MSDYSRPQLAAVLSADIVGYSKLMGNDQSKTLVELRHLRNELFNPAVERFHGETVKSMGDGWIVVFSSVNEALQSATEIQNGLADFPIFELRIGVHIGDIVREEDDLFGDGVNIAARLQSVAAPGDILISDVAHQSLNGTLRKSFHENPPAKLKNIERLIPTFSWLNIRRHLSQDEGGDHGKAHPKKICLAFNKFELSGSGEDAQSLCDGVNDAVLGAIGNQASLSLRTHKEGADILVEGSMKVVGERYRVVVRLLDQKNDELIKSETFNGIAADLFDAEDDLALRISTSIRFGALAFEARSLKIDGLSIENQDNKVIRVHVAGNFGELTADKWLEARRFLDIAIEREPDDHSALAMGGLTYLVEPCCGWRPASEDDRTKALDQLGKSVRINPRGDFAHAMLSLALTDLAGDHVGARFEAEQSLKIAPHYAQGQMALAYSMICAGSVDEGTALAIKAIEPIKSLRLFPWNASYLMLGLLLSKQYDEVLNCGQMADQQVRNVPRILLPMISAASHLGATDQAQNYVGCMLTKFPDFSLDAMRVWPLKRAGDWDHFQQGLIAAGLPKN